MRKKNLAAILAAVLSIGITLYSGWELVGKGVLSWHIRQPEFHSMVAELALIWLLLFSIFYLIGNYDYATSTLGSVCLVSVILLFSWCHQVFFPLLFTGGYVLYLVGVGRSFCRRVLRQDFGIYWNFLFGCAVTISMFCLLSALQLGSIGTLRLWVFVSGSLLLGSAAYHGWKKRKVCAWQLIFNSEKPTTRKERVMKAAMLAAIVVLVLLQLGRMNQAVDHDSLWYGVRSQYMLDSGNGIYEDLTTVSVVYTYSKGFETLLLPLADLPSYSFTIAMNVWIAVLCLGISYRIARICCHEHQAMWVPFLMAAVPGIMNMADTAKADLMTLYCQLLMLHAMEQWIKSRRRISNSGKWLLLCLFAGGVSLTLKPTAVIFSTAILGVSVLWIAGMWFVENKRKETGGVWIASVLPTQKRIYLILLPAVTALIGIWGRTMKLVGVPVTSVFSSLLAAMGFSVKYPFSVTEFPSSQEAGVGDALIFLGKRLYGILCNPQGEDMAHVIIAWGTVFPAVFGILWLCLRWYRMQDEKSQDVKTQNAKSQDADEQGEIRSWLFWLLVAFSFINLVSLSVLAQIDGNYYMVFYAMLLLAGGIWMSDCQGVCRKVAQDSVLFAWCLAVLLCGLTNWAWTLGNGGISWRHNGYYPHSDMVYQARAVQGSEEIWKIFASNPKNRVIAMGEHPGVLTFPCWVQSYVDISGYWGNAEIVANEENFLKYLQFAKIDYIYIEKEYIDESVRIYQIVRKLIAEGWLDQVLHENGNLVIRVRKERLEVEQEITDNLWVLDERYIQHP